MPVALKLAPTPCMSTWGENRKTQRMLPDKQHPVEENTMTCVKQKVKSGRRAWRSHGRSRRLFSVVVDRVQTGPRQPRDRPAVAVKEPNGKTPAKKTMFHRKGAQKSYTSHRNEAMGRITPEYVRLSCTRNQYTPPVP